VRNCLGISSRRSLNVLGGSAQSGIDNAVDAERLHIDHADEACPAVPPIFGWSLQRMRAYAGWGSETAGAHTFSTVRRFVSPVRVVQSIDLPTGSPIRAVPMGVSTEIMPFEMSACCG
jgi:hypothetical protein